MKTDTQTLARAMDILARDIQSQDGIANAAIREAAERLRELDGKIDADLTRLERERDEARKIAEKLRKERFEARKFASVLHEDQILLLMENAKLRDERDEAFKDLAFRRELFKAQEAQLNELRAERDEAREKATRAWEENLRLDSENRRLERHRDQLRADIAELLHEPPLKIQTKP